MALLRKPRVKEHDGILMYENLIKQIYNANVFIPFIYQKLWLRIIVYYAHMLCYVFLIYISQHFMAFFKNYYSNSFMFKRMKKKSVARAREKFPLKLTRIFGLKNCTMFNVLGNCLRMLCHFLQELRGDVQRCKRRA